MLLRSLADRRVLFAGGKGGVGKTSVASALALDRARQGERVLLVSTDPAHNLGHLWGRDVGDAPTRVTTDTVVDAVEIDPDRTVARHLAEVRRTMLRLLPERMHGPAERHLDLAREAPGTHESAVLDRLAEVLEDGLASHDLVVVDTAPTGHTLRLLAMPEQLTSWTTSLLANRDRAEKFGAAVRGLGGGTEGDGDTDAELRRVLLRRQRRFAALRDVVADHERTAFVVVTTAERMPVTESLALLDQLRELGIAVGGVVANRRSPVDAGDLLAERRRLEDDQLATLRARSDGVPLVEVPLLPGDLTGEHGVAALVDALTVG
ncbi:ArsA family ATPase [Nocardioides panacisoli]|uniref:ArsA family ATPase n=1 Tax=Nocardioides panacisoli TaxID=627624 RepID=UPI001C638915|nr:ArsA family ATPase [Nocardioides panacisoli]QYJ03381.1 ArsA family ATPase [Nocardioides panacisoli]